MADAEHPTAGEAEGEQEVEEIKGEAAALLDDMIAANRELDVEDIDLFLNRQDPEFARNVTAIAHDKSLRAAEIQELDDEAAALFEETQKWAQARGWRRFLFRLFPFIPRLTYGARRSMFRIFKFLRGRWIWLKNETHDLVVRSWKGLVHGVKDTRERIRNRISEERAQLRRMPLRLKLLLYFTMLVIAAAMGGIFLALTGRILPSERKLFLWSVNDIATAEYEYEPGVDQEFFYDNLRSMPNLFLFPKIVANIRPSSQSKENPMVAVELFAEAFSPEAMFELKDREPLMRDMAQRVIEDFSFDELESAEGKRRLTQAVARELNRVLSKGQLKGVHIKTIVLKP